MPETLTPCIRRPNSRWTACRCPDCRVHSARMAKLVRNNRYQRVSPEQAWEVLDRLLERDWTGRAIASATGIPATALGPVLADLRRRGKRRRFSPHHAAAIVNHGAPTAGMVGAVGACRRLQGLARQGWDLYRMAELTGVGWSTLAQIRNGRTRRVSAATHGAICEAVDGIGMTVGESTQAITHAAAEGWIGLLAWRDVDDPSETPEGYRPMHPSFFNRETGKLELAPPEPVDEVAVQRILNGDWRLPCSRADKEAVVAAWQGSLNDLARLTGWKTDRYVARDPEAAA